MRIYEDGFSSEWYPGEAEEEVYKLRDKLRQAQKTWREMMGSLRMEAVASATVCAEALGETLEFKEKDPEDEPAPF